MDVTTTDLFGKEDGLRDEGTLELERSLVLIQKVEENIDSISQIRL